MSITNVSGVIDSEVPISVNFSNYSNVSMLFISQVNKLGVFILAENENPEAEIEEKVYNVEVKFGDRCDEWSIALARGIVQKLNIGKIIIVLSVIQRNPQVYNLILESLPKIIN